MIRIPVRTQDPVNVKPEISQFIDREIRPGTGYLSGIHGTTFTPPTGKLWRVVALYAFMNTTADVIDRYLRVAIPSRLPNFLDLNFVVSEGVPADTNAYWMIAPGMPVSSARIPGLMGTQTITFPIPEIWIDSWTGLQVAPYQAMNNDQWRAVLHYIEVET